MRLNFVFISLLKNLFFLLLCKMRFSEYILLAPSTERTHKFSSKKRKLGSSLARFSRSEFLNVCFSCGLLCPYFQTLDRGLQEVTLDVRGTCEKAFLGGRLQEDHLRKALTSHCSRNPDGFFDYDAEAFFCNLFQFEPRGMLQLKRRAADFGVSSVL